MGTSSTLLTTICAVLLLGACTGKKLSDRDQKLQQQKSQGEAKKQELAVVGGQYHGQLKSDAGLEQAILLNLEIKEVPESQEGSVDPVLVPKIVGYLRFLYGGVNTDEYVDCIIKQADYRGQSQDLYLVVNHAQFGDLNIEGKRNENVLQGRWKAAQVGASGTIQVNK